MPVRTTCPYCGVGCGLKIARDDTDNGWNIKGDPQHPANLGRVCSKGAALNETLGLEERLLHPEIGGRRADWDEALTTVADRFSRTIAEHGPDSVAFYVSGQLLTEDYYVANKLMKGFIGSANIDTNSRLCMASAVAGHKRAFGEDIVPCSYEDLEAADLIVIVGSNLAWCHPVLYQRIAAARERRAAEKSAPRIVVIDPRRTATCDIADLHLPIRSGSDVMLFYGLLHWLRREDALDWQFLERHTEGWAAALETAKSGAASIPAVAAACDVPEADIAKFYQWFTRTPRTVTVFSQGVNQSDDGTDKVNAIINLHLATGRIGKRGTGPFSVTGQPNAMGGREVGGLANQLAAHMEFSDAHVDRVARFWNAPAIATRPGLKAVDMFDAIAAGRIRAVWIMATNPVVSMPDADRVKRALADCEFVVVSDCVRRTDTTACADVLLPAAAWGEKSGTVTNSERSISRQRPFLQPAGDSRPDWWIVTEVAQRMGFGDAFAYTNPAEIFREHARLSAFENDGERLFDIGALAELSDEAYDEMRPVQWPVRKDIPEAPRPFADGRFSTSTGRAMLIATPPRENTSRTPELRLNSGRLRDQWHTMTRTGLSPRLSMHHVEPFVDVHPRDAREAGVRHGELAELRARDARVIVRVQISRDVRPGELFAPMHWNGIHTGLGRIGTLIAPDMDPVSGQPALKKSLVELAPFRPAWHGFVLSRDALDLTGNVFWASARGRGYWRYEIAGDHPPASWQAWARSQVYGDEWLELADRGAGRYRAACLSDGRLKACLFVSATPALPGREWLGSLFANDTLDTDARRSLLLGRAPSGGADPGPVVCACFSVGRNTLLRAIREQSLVNAGEIGQALSAGTNCGSCVPELNALLTGAREESSAA